MCPPKVSIIVPVYNGESFIQDTLKMLCESSLHDIEIIVIDDGSTDSSLKFCEILAKKDSRIRIFRQKNQGVFAARNHGLREARGDYICFCDQDDLIERTAYEIMYLRARQYDCDIVMASTGKLIGEKKENFESLPDAVFENDEIRIKCMLPILFNGINYGVQDGTIRLENDIWKCMVKRELVTKNNFQFRRIVNYEDDFLFLLDILSKATRVVTLSKVLYYWRVNLGSETYNTAYVEDLYGKDIVLQNEIVSIMENAHIDQASIDVYKKCQNCNRYIHIIENENRNKQEKKCLKIKRIQRIQEETDYAESLCMRKYYRGNLLHRKLLLGMLEKKAFVCAYMFHKCYVLVRRGGLHFKIWTRLENVLYGKK